MFNKCFRFITWITQITLHMFHKVCPWPPKIPKHYVRLPNFKRYPSLSLMHEVPSDRLISSYSFVLRSRTLWKWNSQISFSFPQKIQSDDGNKIVCILNSFSHKTCWRVSVASFLRFLSLFSFYSLVSCDFSTSFLWFRWKKAYLNCFLD